MLAPAASYGGMNRGDDVQGRRDAGEPVGERCPREAGRVREPEDAGLGEVVDVVADAAAGGAGRAVSGERRDDERRVILAEPFVIDAEARRDARTESLDHDGGLVREALEGRASPLGLEVERERVRP